MQNGFISFRPKIITLPGSLRLVLTDSAYNALAQGRDYQQVMQALCDLSRTKLLLTYASKTSSPSDEAALSILTDYGTMVCAAKNSEEESSLVVKTFAPITLRTNNLALKYGVSFRVPDNALLIIKLRLTAKALYCDIADGKVINTDDRDRFTLPSGIVNPDQSVHVLDMDVSSSVQAMISGTGNDPDLTESDDEEDFVPEEDFRSLLHTASQYAVFDYDLEKKKAEKAGRLNYSRIDAVEKDTVDRRAYRFILTGEADRKTFSEGCRIDVVDRSDGRHPAEIKALTNEYIELLFSRQEDIELLKDGYITLSVSSVQKRVRTDVISKLMNGTAKAQYMNGVFGSHTYRPFSDHVSKNALQKKYTALKAESEAKGKKYFPPNESQLTAIVGGINSGDVYLVMGPPGTGKTTVILEWVKYFVSQNRRVLISSQNNKAVDNVLERLREEEQVNMIRIGSELKVQDNVRGYIFENKIAAKRREIDQSCGSHLKLLGELIKTWRKRLQLLHDYEDALADSEQFMRAMTRLAAAYKSAYTECARTRAEFQELHSQALMLHEQLNSAELTSPDIRVSDDDRRRLLTYLRTRYRSLLHELSLRKAVYSRSRAEMDAAYRACLRHHREYADQQNRFDALNRQYRTAIPYVYNKWDLFRDPSAFLNDPAAIEKELERAESLRSIVGSWRSGIADTQNYALDTIMLESINLVGATCIGINSKPRFADLHFDVTIIDEAGQIQVHNALVPMSVSDKLIMLGDHKQIPPAADKDMVELCRENNERTDYLSASLFEKMYDQTPDSNKSMLDTQFRMPGQIADIISEWFYNKQYHSGDFKYTVESILPRLSEHTFLVIDTSDAEEHGELKDPEGGCSNPLEAQVVSGVAAAALSSGVSFEQIGCISAYSKQVAAIRSRIKTDAKAQVSAAQIAEMVSSLDSFQGQERELIIYSFTRSSRTNPNIDRIGFLKEIRRLNVAMTRPTKMLVMVGDIPFLTGCRSLARDEDGNPTEVQSERRFSAFIRFVVKKVKAGSGEMISYKEYQKRIKGV